MSNKRFDYGLTRLKVCEPGKKKKKNEITVELLLRNNNYYIFVSTFCTTTRMNIDMDIQLRGCSMERQNLEKASSFLSKKMKRDEIGERSNMIF